MRRKEKIMGAWDYDPFDNDDASDFWQDVIVSKNPVELLKYNLNNNCSGHEYERRAATAFVTWILKMDRRELRKCKKLAVNALEELISDEEFTSDWTASQSNMKRRLGRELKKLKEV